MVVAIGALSCYFASAIAALDQIYNSRAAGLPLYFGFRLNLVSGNTREAYQAGVRRGDPVLAINGRPFTGYVVLIEELRRSHAGDTLGVTFIPRPSPPGIPKAVNPQDINYPGHSDLQQEAPPRTVAIRLQPATPQRPTFFHLLTEIYFLIIFFPLVCLLLAFWVVASKPRDKNAWFMLGILVYFAGVFGKTNYWGGAALRLHHDLESGMATGRTPRDHVLRPLLSRTRKTR
jgi:hypothetical protein